VFASDARFQMFKRRVAGVVENDPKKPFVRITADDWAKRRRALPEVVMVIQSRRYAVGLLP